MASVLELITDSMRDIGALAIEETPTNAEAQLCFRKLNSMIETWTTESLLVYNIAPQTFAYVGGQQSYTMGTGGDFNATRPVTITQAKNRTNAGTVSEVDYDIYVTDNAQEYADIVTKRIQTVLPTVLYYNNDYPLQRLYFWPAPSNTTYAPVIWSWGLISSFATIGDSISLPPGYYRALQTNLCIEIAPSFGITISAELGVTAVDSKAQLKRINMTVNELQLPYAIPGTEKLPGLPQFLGGLT